MVGRRQPPKRRLPKPTLPSGEKQLERFLGCCEYSIEQFEANRNKNLLNYEEHAGSSLIAQWYLSSQKEEFEHQRAVYTSYCVCNLNDEDEEGYDENENEVLKAEMNEKIKMVIMGKTETVVDTVQKKEDKVDMIDKNEFKGDMFSQMTGKENENSDIKTVEHLASRSILSLDVERRDIEDIVQQMITKM